MTCAAGVNLPCQRAGGRVLLRAQQLQRGGGRPTVPSAESGGRHLLAHTAHTSFWSPLSHSLTDRHCISPCIKTFCFCGLVCRASLLMMCACFVGMSRMGAEPRPTTWEDGTPLPLFLLCDSKFLLYIPLFSLWTFLTCFAQSHLQWVIFTQHDTVVLKQVNAPVCAVISKSLDCMWKQKAVSWSLVWRGPGLWVSQCGAVPGHWGPVMTRHLNTLQIWLVSVETAGVLVPSQHSSGGTSDLVFSPGSLLSLELHP